MTTCLLNSDGVNHGASLAYNVISSAFALTESVEYLRHQSDKISLNNTTFFFGLFLSPFPFTYARINNLEGNRKARIKCSSNCLPEISVLYVLLVNTSHI